MKEHHKWMEMALQQAREALAVGDFPVGCVIEYQNEIIATGRRCNSFGAVNEIDHAEIVALRALLESEPHIIREEVTVYSTMEPCLMCFSTLLVNGVRKIAYSYEDAMGGGTNLPLKLLSPLYRNLEIKITGGIMREEGLHLFKEFFSNPDNDYLKDSLLAAYTLKQ
ncbi:MAG: nucleoside deaminase [Desulforhopalus sp.]